MTIKWSDFEKIDTRVIDARTCSEKWFQNRLKLHFFI